jgi:hypothetical protein
MSQRSKNALHRRFGAEPPQGKHAQGGSRLIGYGILLVALLLIAIGSVLA